MHRHPVRPDRPHIIAVVANRQIFDYISVFCLSGLRCHLVRLLYIFPIKDADFKGRCVRIIILPFYRDTLIPGYRVYILYSQNVRYFYLYREYCRFLTLDQFPFRIRSLRLHRKFHFPFLFHRKRVFIFSIRVFRQRVRQYCRHLRAASDDISFRCFSALPGQRHFPHTRLYCRSNYRRRFPAFPDQRAALFSGSLSKCSSLDRLHLIAVRNSCLSLFICVRCPFDRFDLRCRRFPFTPHNRQGIAVRYFLNAPAHLNRF